MSGAHPRVGGDGFDCDHLHRRSWGSPPRGRGRPWPCLTPGCEGGLTPAWAGTAPRHVGARLWRRAHPRVGGDGWHEGSGLALDLGSPPRGRGRQGAHRNPRRRWGLTPAWAGTASGICMVASFSRAHPRVGGDGRGQWGPDDIGQGSPPRGRGRPGEAQQIIDGRGLTPAWAGTASAAVEVSPGTRAHPRVGGDGPATDYAAMIAKGSPPRGRGRHRRDPGEVDPAGLTPAWAGTASAPACGCAGQRAHPRVGGDGSRSSSPHMVESGSPPRGRGRPN